MLLLLGAIGASFALWTGVGAATGSFKTPTAEECQEQFETGTLNTVCYEVIYEKLPRDF